MTALVVADDPVRRAALGEALESIGLRVELLADAEAARRRLAASLPDVVVLDGRGSQLASFEVYQAVRSHPAGGSIPIIFSHSSEEAIVDDGADHYLPADSDPALVAGKARELLGLPEAESPAAAEPTVAAEQSEDAVEEPPRGRAGRLLQLLLLALGILLLFIAGTLVLLRRDTLSPLIAQPTVKPSTPAPQSSPAPVFGRLSPGGGLSPVALPSPSPSP